MAYIGAGITRFNTADELTVTGDAEFDTNTLIIDSTNNRVGIGTTSPTYKLEAHVAESDTPQDGLNISNGANADFTVKIKNSETQIGPSTATPLLFTNADETERMRLDSSGNLLVGGTATVGGSKFLVAEASNSAPAVIQAASGAGSYLDFYNNAATSNRFRIGQGFAIGTDNIALLYNQVQAAMVFGTNDTERMRILGDTGALQVKVNGANAKAWSGNSNATQVIDNRADKVVFTAEAESSSYAFSGVQRLLCDRSSNSGYDFLVCTSGNLGDDEFRFKGNGNATADGSFSGGGADYAEYFEWSDGNASNEDRRGYTVVLDGNKVRKATDADDASQIIGAVSANPCVIGDHAENKWTGKYLKDDFGNYIWESHNVVEWTEIVTDEEGNESEKKHSYEDWNIPEGITVPDDATVLTHDDKGNLFEHRKLNPDFDPDAEYIPREKRPEWSPIGMMGKLRIRTGQPVGDRWIKMRDISETVEEWLVR